MTKTVEMTRELTFNRPVHEVWTLLSDSQRLQAVSGAGFSPYEAEDVITASGAVERAAHKKIGPITLRWREKMGEWTVHEFFSQVRLFETGPYQELTVNAHFSEADGQTRVRGHFVARWSGLVGTLLYRCGILHWMTRQPMKAMHTIMEEYENLGLPVPREELHTVSARAKDRLTDAMAEVEKGPYGHDLTQSLTDFLLKADPHSLRRIRPLALARAWGLPEQQLIETCMAAHKAGVLSMRWVVLCPRCRGGKSDTDKLENLPDTAHCTSCNINFESDFVNNVELVFSPSAWLRALPRGSYCMMSPANVPHIKWQQQIGPGEIVEKALNLPAARYRIRTVEAGGEIIFEHDGREWIGITQDGDAVRSDPTRSGPGLAVRNDGDHPRTIVVENAKFSQDRLTIGRLATVSAFRESCPDQLLRARQTAGIGQVAILFSDLQKSTALYEEIGDAAAYALVVEHFEFMEEHVRNHGGVVIKTVGDAVMAAFADGEAALQAALDIQREFAGFNASRDQPDLSLKIGVHEGTCVAMRSENGLDFFGRAVNLAARLQAQADGGEIVLSAELARSGLPEHHAAADITWDKAVLSGFDDPVEFARLRCSGTAAAR